LAFSKLDKYFKDFFYQLMFAEWSVKITANAQVLLKAGYLKNVRPATEPGFEN
jgi:hypothetical protein